MALLVVLSIVAAQCAPAPEAAPSEEYKLAAIFPGVITDADYNTLAYVGR